MIDAINPLPLMHRKTPTLAQVENTEEVRQTARDFTSVFFQEYIAIMLEESKEEDEEFSMDVYRGLHAQVLAEKMSDSGAGKHMTEMMMREINKLQAKVQGGRHD